MKYLDKTHPMREVCLYDPKWRGNDRVIVEMTYTIYGKNSQTFVRQPIEFSVCHMRYLGGEFHRILNEIEDRLVEAREHMKGDR